MNKSFGNYPQKKNELLGIFLPQLLLLAWYKCDLHRGFVQGILEQRNDLQKESPLG